MGLLLLTAGCKDEAAQQKINELQAQVVALQKRQQEMERQEAQRLAEARKVQEQDQEALNEAVQDERALKAKARKGGLDSAERQQLALLEGIEGLDPSKFIGAWNLTYKANHSTCDGVNIGDVISATLQVSVLEGQVRATESIPNLKDQRIELAGVEGMGVYRFSRKDDSGSITLELSAKGKGKRIVARQGCSINYDVSGKRVQ